MYLNLERYILVQKPPHINHPQPKPPVLKYISIKSSQPEAYLTQQESLEGFGTPRKKTSRKKPACTSSLHTREDPKYPKNSSHNSPQNKIISKPGGI
ncbi:hypothetical protein Avbf_18327 [Armadillidium vulgare]|nr:hypothetical protein Avbf_18327 [Armadillidium vulgare]